MKIRFMSAALLSSCLVLLATVPAFAQPQIDPAGAIKAVEAAPEVKSIYAVYYKNHKKGGCAGCEVTGAAEIAKEEIPKIVVKDCSDSGAGWIYCSATLTKQIYTNDDYIHELTIDVSLAQDTKKKITVELKNIQLNAELND